MTPDELIAKWGALLPLVRHVPTWTEDYNLCFCAEQASQGTVGVELGTYMGASALIMLLANPDLHLWCVDNFHVFGSQKVSEYFLRDFIEKGRCELIVGDSALASKFLEHMRDKLDFVWVDDGHATEDVLRDIRCFYPLLKSGGVMFGHDWDGDNDVAQGVMQSGIHYSIPVPRLWYSKKS